MGIKGDKLSRDSTITAELIAEKLGSIDGISTKKMFGGHGIFHEGKMFCIVDSKGMGFLKVNASNRFDFEEKNAVQHSRMPYFSIPKDIFDNNDAFVQWSKKSIAINT